MDTLDRESLTSLTREFGFPCISLYMPTHRAGAAKEQDPIRLRNLLSQASAQLIDGGMRGPDAEAALAPLRSLLDDPGFWRETGDGLAAFLSHKYAMILRLDSVFPELVSVGDRFVIRPLLPAMHTERVFWLLALSKNSIRLFDANHENIAEVPIPDSPGTFREAMKYEDDTGHGFQFHPESTGSPSGSRRSTVYYGAGGLPDAEKDQVERFVRMVEKAVGATIRGSDKPLVLAGVEYEVSRYRAVNSYPNLLADALLGNFDETPVAELHTRARQLVAPHFDSRLRSDAAEIEAGRGSAAVSEDLGVIVSAAHGGRVRTLFVGDSPGAWGRYDPATGTVDVHEEPAPGDGDLAEIAALETLSHGGDVHVVPGPFVPDSDTPTPAAVMRY
jgi:hypothetical protein